MKRLLSLLLVLLMATAVLSADRMPTPRPYSVILKYGDQPVKGLAISFTVGSDTVTKITNSNGAVMVDLDVGYSGDFPNSPKTLSALMQNLVINCGYAACDKTYIIADIDTYEETFTLYEQPEIPDVPVIPDIPEEPNTNPTSDEEKKVTSIDLYYGESAELEIGNNKLTKLFSGTVEFDSEDYDVEEILYLTANVKTSLDNEDFGDIPYLLIDKIEYKYIFKDQIDISKITEDETLKIKLLGKEVEISEAETDQITLLSGTEYYMAESTEKDGIKIISVGTNYARIEYAGVSESISEGEIDNIGGMEFYVTEINYDDDGPDYVEFMMGKDIKVTIEDGDDYSDAEIYEWVINLPESIGIINIDPFEDLEEDNKPLAPNTKITLPNDFVDIKFTVTEPDTTEVQMKVKGDMLYVTGDFSKGTEDYNAIYVGENAIYDKDKELIAEDNVQIGNSNFNLERGSVKIGDLTIKLDMSDILYKGVSIAGKDYNILDYLGLLFRDPEQAIEDKRGFKVTVPDERPEAKISIGIDLPAEEATECPAIPECVCETPEQTDCNPVPCEAVVCFDNCPSATCPSCEECKDKDCPNSLVAIIITLLATCGITIGGYNFYLTKNKKLKSK